MSSQATQFPELLELIDRFPLDQRKSLVEIVRRRNSEDGRNRIAVSGCSPIREHRVRKTKPATPDELMREISD